MSNFFRKGPRFAIPLLCRICAERLLQVPWSTHLELGLNVFLRCLNRILQHPHTAWSTPYAGMQRPADAARALCTLTSAAPPPHEIQDDVTG